MYDENSSQVRSKVAWAILEARDLIFPYINGQTATLPEGRGSVHWELMAKEHPEKVTRFSQLVHEITDRLAQVPSGDSWLREG